MRRFLASLLLLIAPFAAAQDATQIAAFDHGRFEDAAFAGEQTESADQYAFRARALLADAMCQNTQPSNDFLKAPEEFARKALEMDPDHVEAKIQLAITLSLYARPLSSKEALQTGHGSKAKKLVKSALKADPGNAYAHGFMAVWNIEVVRRGGSFGASVMGASVNNARRHYAKAVETLPYDASLHWQYARALAALNPKKYRKDIDRALEYAQVSPIDNHLEQVMAERADELRDRLSSSSRADIAEWANEML